MVPIEIVGSEIILYPPYQTISPIKTEEEISATGKIELIQTVFNQASL